MDRLEPSLSLDTFWRATHCLTAGASPPANTAVNAAAAAACVGFHKLSWEVIVLKEKPPSLWRWMFGCWSSSLHWDEVSCPAVCMSGPWLLSLGTPGTTASLQPAALANYCNLMSWPCLSEPACRHEAANTAGCYTALRWYIRAVRFIPVQTSSCYLSMFALVLIMIGSVLLWLSSLLFGRCITKLPCCLFTQ